MTAPASPLTVVVLGSGTSVPEPRRRPPAFLVATPTTSVMLDCGAGSTTGLAAAGVTLDALDGLLLSHLHLDHTGELAPLLFALRNPVGPRRARDLPIWGPRGLADQLAGLRGVYGDWLEPPGIEVALAELAPGRSLSIGDLTIEPFAVRHSGDAFAFRVGGGGKIICYSGDSGPCAGLVEAARDADLFLCECGALESEGLDEHLTPTSAGQVAAEAGCRKLVLTHLYRRVVDSDPLPRVRASFDGEVLLGADGMTLIGRSE